MTDTVEQCYNKRSTYNHPGWEVIRLADYFEDIDTEDALPLVDEMSRWCMANVPALHWERNGVTKYSYRFQFKDKLDALAFKLRFPT